MILIEKSRLNLIGAYGALGLAVFLLQTTLLSVWRILQVTPVMTVAAVVCVAVFEGEVTGGLFGLFLGLALDATVSTNSGAAALSLLLVGALSGFVWGLDPALVFLLMRADYVVKFVLGLLRVRSGKWIRVVTR